MLADGLLMPLIVIEPPDPSGLLQTLPSAVDPSVGWKIGESGPRVEQVLADMLKTSGQSKWKDVDGTGGTMTVIPGRLIVRQSYQGHIEIQGLLNAVEHLLVRAVKAKSLEVRRPGYPFDEDAKIVERLTQPFTIDADEQPVQDVLQSVATLSSVRQWIERPALMEQGINIDQQATLKYTSLPLYAVLKFLLEPISMTAIVEEGTLLITAATRADTWQSVRVYNVSDITGISADDLIAAIESCGEDKWEHVSGDGGAHFLVGSRLLVIRQSPRIQAEINNLLEELRKNSDSRQPPGTPKLERRIYAISDSAAIADLIRSLPELIPNWDAKLGSIHRLGSTLAINQTAVVHDRISEIIRTLSAADASLHPPAAAAEPPQSQCPSCPTPVFHLEWLPQCPPLRGPYRIRRTLEFCILQIKWHQPKTHLVSYVPGS